MELSWELLVNALVSGLLLGGFYAAAVVGITIAWGMLDIVNIAHPAFIVLGAFIAYYLNTAFGYPARPQTSVVRQSHQIPCPPQLSRCWRAAASIGAVDISCAARRSSWRWSIWVSSPSLTTRRPPQ